MFQFRVQTIPYLRIECNSAPGKSDLFTKTASANSTNQLFCLDPISTQTLNNHNTVCKCLCRTSDCPAPTVSITTLSHPKLSKILVMSSTITGTLPEALRVCNRAQINLLFEFSLSTTVIRTRSPRRAPPVRGEEGSTASTAIRDPAMPIR